MSSVAVRYELLAKGADVNARIHRRQEHDRAHGAWQTLQERGGQSAVFGAVQWGWPRVVQYLIGHDAKVDIKDDLGVSPLDAASGKGGSADNRPSQP